MPSSTTPKCFNVEPAAAGSLAKSDVSKSEDFWPSTKAAGNKKSSPTPSGPFITSLSERLSPDSFLKILHGKGHFRAPGVPVSCPSTLFNPYLQPIHPLLLMLQ